ncbi:MAG: response regulator [Xenococcaceae cyanobacterium MO_188.B19]|nr:response regulator [Xenococcaceae cyanobacterium MO_188.B19]
MTLYNSRNKPLILIADDDRSMRALLNLAMTEEGYEVAEAKNGKQCLAEYQLLKPDAVLLDGVMPDLNGFACCEKIRQLPGGESIPILIITVLDDQKSIDQAFSCGATDYITKPIHWAVLSQRMRRLLATNQTLQEVQAVKQQLEKQQSIINQLCNLAVFLALPNTEY